MLGLEVVVAVGVTILLAHLLAPRLHIATPVALLALGVMLGFIPQLRSTPLPPELVLLVLLPVLLYWESLTTSPREIRSNITSIALLSTALVVATAGAVAVAAHAFGLAWGPAWVLGAAVAPTDATATAALGKMLPARQVTVLRAESLVNDGTALVIFGVAVTVTVDEQAVTAGAVTLLVLLAYLGGAAVGTMVAWVNIQLRRRLDDPLLGNLVMILAPFTAFLLAELIRASGVLAVVVSGLILSQAAPKVIQARHRIQAVAFWSLLTFLINGTLFVIVGVELQFVARSLTGSEFSGASVMVVVVSGVVITTRFAFLLASTGARALVGRGAERGRQDWRGQIVAGLTGFRGAVSLAVALSVPQVLSSGAAFPARDLIVFVTGGVVLVTLVGQAIALPFAVRAAGQPEQSTTDAELAHATIAAFQGALDALPQIARDAGTNDRVIGWLREEYQTNVGSARANTQDDVDAQSARNRADYVQLSLALIAHRRTTIIGLRDRRVIDDTVLRRLQIGLDTEELRLLSPEPIE